MGSPTRFLTRVSTGYLLILLGDWLWFLCRRLMILSPRLCSTRRWALTSTLARRCCITIIRNCIRSSQCPRPTPWSWIYKHFIKHSQAILSTTSYSKKCNSSRKSGYSAKPTTTKSNASSTYPNPTATQKTQSCSNKATNPPQSTS